MKHAIVIVEDYSEMLFVYGEMFRKVAAVEVVGQFHSAEEALEHIDRLRPRLLIADMVLTGMNGLELIRAIRRRGLDMKFLLLTGMDPRQYREAALEAGADELLSKARTGDLVDSVKKLLGIRE